MITFDRHKDGEVIRTEMATFDGVKMQVHIEWRGPTDFTFNWPCGYTVTNPDQLDIAAHIELCGCGFEQRDGAP